MSFNIGANIGHYRIIEQLGRGGMATVYKAYHANLDRYVALKVLHPAFLEDDNFQARFQREARLVAKLEHPNIVPIYDFAEYENQPYLVMKYIEGETLKAHLSRGRLSVEQIWNIVNAVGAGLAYAHEKGILHRDVKPSNVILGKDGQVYLADFGLARIAERGESTLSGDMIMGTPQYISPEQAMGVKDLDEGTDIYSFAVMLYEMVVGQVPFSSDTPFSIIHDHIYSPLPLPKTVNPSVPDEVERVLLKALAKERDDRYQDVPALVDAFTSAWDEADADMAEVTMTSPIRRNAVTLPVSTPKAETAQKPTETAPAPTRIASDEAASPQTETSPTSTRATAKPSLTKPPKKKKRAIWAFIAVGLLIVFASFFIVSALEQNGLFGQLSEENTPVPEEDFKEPEILPETPPERIDPQKDEPVEVTEARALVDENPEDPYVHLELALALLDAFPGQNPEVYRELKAGANLANKDVQFFETAGSELMSRGVWAGSAAMFLRGVKITQFEGEANPDLVDLLHESAYKAASLPEMPTVLPFDEIGAVDEPLRMVVEARHIYYHGNPDDAFALLNEVKRMKPGFPEARLLEGEMLARGGKTDDARKVFEIILADLETPEWISVEAEEALGNLP